MRHHPAVWPAAIVPGRLRSAVTAAAAASTLSALSAVSRAVPVLLAAVIAGPGCTNAARSNSHYRYPREVTYGRTSTCPDVRLPPLRDGGLSPDAARCSYADANGAKVTHLAGKVLAEGGPGDPGTGVPAVGVTVHAVAGPVFDIESPGPVVAHATTDAQGNYSLRGVFIAGDYAIVVREATGERITERVVRVEPNAVGSIKDLRVLVPIDPRLRAEAAEPPTPSADPRLKPPPAPTPTPTPAVSATTAPTAPTAPTTPAPARPKPNPGLRMRPPPPPP